MNWLLIFFPLLLVSQISVAQPVDEQVLRKIVSNRNKRDIGKNDSLLLAIYGRTDSVARVQLLDFFDKESSSSDPYTAARSLAWKAVVLRRPPFNSKEAEIFMQQANNRSIESGDSYLQVQCFEIYAADCMSQERPETALFYYLKAAELRKNLDDAFFFYKTPAMYGAIGDLLHKMQEYAQSTRYISKAFHQFHPIKVHIPALITPSASITSGSGNTILPCTTITKPFKTQKTIKTVFGQYCEWQHRFTVF